jgi:tRNA dimethylallyltransferase
MLSPLIIIAGPTGVGKTETVLKLAEPLSAEIISADSMQIYRKMDIGTAKPTREELACVPHHIIDVVEPDDPFDAAQFVRMAEPIIDRIHSSARPVFVAGGTGLYIKALIHGIFPCPRQNKEIREKLSNEAERLGPSFIFDRLRRVDPESATKIHPNDKQRIIRAIEVFELTGIPLSEHHQAHRFQKIRHRTLKIGLTMDRGFLYERIDRRVDQMLEEGLVDEVEGILRQGFSPHIKSMQSIGYSHVTKFLHGDLSFDEMVRTLKRDTRRYAKRQLTWFGADPQVIWMELQEIDGIRKKVNAFLDNHALGLGKK